MRTTEVVPAAVPPPVSGGDPRADSEALFKEARRRQRRRYAAMGMAMVVIAGGTAGAFAGLHGASRRPAGRPPASVRPRLRSQARRPVRVGVSRPIPRSVGSTELMWPVGPGQSGGIFVDNLRTRRLRLAPTPSIDPGEFQPIMPAGRWVIYAGTNGVSAVRSEGKGRPRRLGTAQLFAPAATPGHVWLEYGAVGAGPVTVRSIPVAGGPAGPPIGLPGRAQLIAGTDAGLVLSGRHGIQLWNPGGPPRTLPHSSSAQGFDVSARLVSYDTGCTDEQTAPSLSYEPNAGFSACRMLRVFDVVTGRLRSFAAPPGTSGWIANHGGFVDVSAIARSGTMMAADAVIPPGGHGRVRAFVLRLADGYRRPTAVPSSTAFLWAVMAWSARGSWLLYQGPGTHMWAYQVTTGRARSSRTPCCQYTVMATITSPAR